MLSNCECDPVNRDDRIPSVLCGPKGDVCLNGAKSYEKWYVGGFLGANNAFPPSIPANGTMTLFLSATQQDNQAGNLDLSQLVGLGLTSFKLAGRLYSPWLDRYFSNVPVPIEAMFGTSNLPAFLAGSLFIKAGTALKLETLDFSGSSNQCTLVGRGFKKLIGPGLGPQARQEEEGKWNFYRKFLPYFLGPDLGPQVPAASQTAVADQSSQQLTFTIPNEGDFYCFAAYLFTWNTSNDTPQDNKNVSIVTFTEGGSSMSFIDPLILPLRSDAFFSGTYGCSGFMADNRIRASEMPGGMGANIWGNCGQWIHRFHRGTQIQLTLKNTTGTSVRFSVVFVGYLATCDSPPSEFLAFPPSTGEQTRQIRPIMAGDPTCTGPACPPGLPSQMGRVIVAPQGVSGPPCPPRSVPLPGRFRSTGRQEW